MIHTSLLAAASGSHRSSGTGIIPSLRPINSTAFAQVLTEALLTRQDRPQSAGSRRQEFPRPMNLSGNVHLSRMLLRSALSRAGSRIPKSIRNLHTAGSASGSEAERLFRSAGYRHGQPVDPKAFDGLIKNAAARYQVPEELVKAVIKVESNFNPDATSRVGAMGLMQLMPGTARDLGVEQPYDPVENINGGTKYLRELLDRYDGNVAKAVAAYNCGMANVEKGRLPQETRSYLKLVSRHYNGSQYLPRVKAAPTITKPVAAEVTLADT